eukprot:COSAG05_NODE_124_length_17559_cov_8.898643_3_plen_91_part_00
MHTQTHSVIWNDAESKFGRDTPWDVIGTVAPALSTLPRFAARLVWLLLSSSCRLCTAVTYKQRAQVNSWYVSNPCRLRASDHASYAQGSV